MTWDRLPCECGHGRDDHAADNGPCGLCGCDWWFPLRRIDGHNDTHDPTVDHVRCEVCREALSAAFTKLADLDLGPRDADTLIERIREMARA